MSTKDLAKWSDLTAVAGDLKWGLATDCPTNPVCGVALKEQYGIDIETLDLTLTAPAARRWPTR